MEIYIRETGAVVQEREFREYVKAKGLAQDPPVNINLPDTMTLELITANGGAPVMEGKQPIAGQFQSVVRDGFTEDDFGVFTKYTLRNWTPEEIAAYKSSAKASKWEGIKAERDRRKSGGVKVGGNWFHTDTESRTQYSILDSKAMRAGWLDTVVIHPNWKTMERNADGSPVYVSMTVALLRNILDAGIVQEAVLFDRAEQHRIAMEAADNPAAYDFAQDADKTKWPVIFGE